MTTAQKTPWYMTGDELVSCSCAWGCPCQFNALPTRGFCDGWLTCRIDKGHYGDVKLDGVVFGGMVWFPGALHEGNGTMQPVMDSSTSPQQRAAIGAILSGKQGGLFFEILIAICPNVLEPKFASVRFTYDRETRTAAVEIPGVGQTVVEPIKNPVTGEEHRARIVLPQGFEYAEAEMGNTVRMQVNVTDKLRMDYSNTYAQLNRFEWKNT